MGRMEAAHRTAELIEAGELPEGASVKPHRTCWCGFPRLSHDGVDIRANSEDEKVHAHFTGTNYCSNIWRCPTCSALIRASRAADVRDAVDRWREQGGSAYLVTMTLRHHKGDELKANLDAMSDAWRKMVSGDPWTRIKRAHGIQGYIKALEITIGENGFHPHYHALFLVTEEATEENAEIFRSKLSPRWIDKVRRAGAKLPSDKYGVDVTPVGEDWEGAARYVGKIAEEVARGDMKEGGEGKSITPFQLLDRDDPEAVALWFSYVEATKRKRCISFSRGLRAALGMDAEKTDEDIVAELETMGDIVAVVDTDVYRRVASREPQRLGELLGLVEAGDLERAAALIGCRCVPGTRFDFKQGVQVDSCYFVPI